MCVDALPRPAWDLLPISAYLDAKVGHDAGDLDQPRGCIGRSENDAQRIAPAELIPMPADVAASEINEAMKRAARWSRFRSY